MKKGVLATIIAGVAVVIITAIVLIVLYVLHKAPFATRFSGLLMTAGTGKYVSIGADNSLILVDSAPLIKFSWDGSTALSVIKFDGTSAPICMNGTKAAVGCSGNTYKVYVYSTGSQLFLVNGAGAPIGMSADNTLQTGKPTTYFALQAAQVPVLADSFQKKSLTVSYGGQKYYVGYSGFLYLTATKPMDSFNWDGKTFTDTSPTTSNTSMAFNTYGTPDFPDRIPFIAQGSTGTLTVYKMPDASLQLFYQGKPVSIDTTKSYLNNLCLIANNATMPSASYALEDSGVSAASAFTSQWFSPLI